jgi:hypothetical protein
MIAENSYLIPHSVKKNFNKDTNFLVVAFNMEESIMQGKDPVEQSITEMKVGIKKEFDLISQKVSNFENKIEERFKKQETDIKEILSIVKGR